MRDFNYDTAHCPQSCETNVNTEYQHVSSRRELLRRFTTHTRTHSSTMQDINSSKVYTCYSVSSTLTCASIFQYPAFDCTFRIMQVV